VDVRTLPSRFHTRTMSKRKVREGFWKMYKERAVVSVGLQRNRSLLEGVS